MVCACGPCGFLFDNPGAGGGSYRRVPDRYLVDPGFTVTDAQWDALAIPVSIAFFLHNTAQDRIIACYPSPAGATESELDARCLAHRASAPGAWRPSCSPTSRRCSCGAGRRACSCRSTPATGSSGWSSCTGAASTAAARRGAAIDAYFAELQSLAREL